MMLTKPLTTLRCRVCSNLADVLQLIVDTLEQGPLPEQELVDHQHQLVLHLFL
jgi:hypothetical protein